VNPNCNGNRRDKVALKTTCIKNVKFKIIKIRTGCHLSVYRILLLQRKPKLGRTKPSTGPHAGRGLDIVGLDFKHASQQQEIHKYMKEHEDICMAVVEKICLMALIHLLYFDVTQAFKKHA